MLPYTKSTVIMKINKNKYFLTVLNLYKNKTNYDYMIVINSELGCFTLIASKYI